MNISDIALLERWVNQRDAEACAALVSRYSSMVYSACLRILRNDADAQDVAQEAFIVLLQNPPRGYTKRSSLGGWLHTVATHRALNRLKTEQRRMNHEGHFAGQDNPSDTHNLDDVQAFVDEAIAGLPDTLRDQLVAHFLEGHSHQAIADTLNLPRRTVTSRVAKGIEEVRKALSKRGVIVSVSALASILTVESTQAVPVALTAALGKLALAKGAGVTSAAISAGGVAAITGGVLAMKTVVTASIAVITIAIAAWLMWPSNPTAQPSQDPPATATPNITKTEPKQTPIPPAPHSATDTKTVMLQGPTISGVVSDTQGRPIEGVSVCTWVPIHDLIKRDGAPTLTGADGSFTLAGLSPGSRFWIKTKKEDMGAMPESNTSYDMKIEGVQGIKITLYRLGGVEGVVVNPKGQIVPEQPVTAQIHTEKYPIRVSCTTDHQGHFKLVGMMPGTHSLSAIPEQEMRRDTEDLRIELKEGELLSGLRLVSGGDGFIIAGRITNEAGEPVKDAMVQCLYKDISPFVNTDAEGKYKLRRLPEGPHGLLLNHPDYEVQWTASIETGREDADFTLIAISHDTVQGHVIDASTGHPITHFEIMHRKSVFSGLTLGDARSFNSVEDPTGQFVLKGVAVVDATIIARAPGYVMGYVPVRQTDGKRVDEVLIRLERARNIHGIVVTPTGEPVVGACIYAECRPPFAAWKKIHDSKTLKELLPEDASAQTDAQGHFILDYIDNSSRRIAAYHPDLGFGLADVSAGTTGVEDLRIVLKRGGQISGHVKTDGQPNANIQIHAFSQEDLEDLYASRTVQTSADGSFHFDEVPEGNILIRTQFSFSTEGSRLSTERLVMVKDGQNTDVPFDYTSGHGTVEGTVTVGGQPSNMGSLSLDMVFTYGKESSRVRTNANGKYSITDLPAGPATLYARLMTPGWQQKNISVNVPESGTVQADMDFSGSGTVSGYITGLKPLEKCFVWVLTGEVAVSKLSEEITSKLVPLRCGLTVVELDGPYGISSLEAGTYTILAIATPGRVYGADYLHARFATTYISLKEGEIITANLSLK